MANEIFGNELGGNVFLGIDPGKKGCVVVIDNTGKLLSIHPTPVIHVTKGKNEYDLHAMARMLKELDTQHRIELVTIEKQQAMPAFIKDKFTKQVKVIRGSTTTFTTGFGYGLWLGILVALELPYQQVSPQKWHNRFFPRGGYLDSKAKAMEAAQALFPNRVFKKSKDGEYDAVLIAEWGRREMYGAKVI